MPTNRKEIYLTFDDGPHPEITSFVLDELDKFKAKASFFCIGKNVVENKQTYDQIILKGHTIGNHTYNHYNGWRLSNEEYLNDVREASSVIDSPLFRPPYGRIRKSQAKKIPEAINKQNTRIIMWDVLSGDFDTSISKEQCLHNVISNAGNGSIIVFHDSEKANKLLQYALPRVLENFAEKNYEFQNLSALIKNDEAER